MPDRNTPGVFDKVILEKTKESSKGVGFKLKELYGKGLIDYYESGLLTFRKVR